MFAAQSQSIQKLTEAITGLTNQGRDNAEAQRASTSTINAIVARFNEHEVADEAKWSINNQEIREDEKSIGSLEITQAAQDVEISRNTGIILSKLNADAGKK